LFYSNLILHVIIFTLSPFMPVIPTILEEIEKKSSASNL